LGKFLRPFFEVFDMQGRYKEGERVFRQAAQRLNAHADGPLDLIQSRALLFQAVCGEMLNLFDEAQRLATAVLPVITEKSAAWEHQLALRCLGRIAYARGEYPEAQRFFEAALSRLQDTPDPGARMAIMLRLADIAAVHGHYREAHDLLEQTRQILHASGNWRHQVRSLVALADLELKLGQLERAEANFGAAMILCEQYEARISLSVALAGLGRVALAQGRFERSETCLERCVSLCEEMAHPWGQAFALRQLGRLSRVRGAFDAARRYLDDSLSISERIGARWLIAAVMSQKARLAAASAQPDDAERYVRRGIEIAADLPSSPLIMEILASAAEIRARRGEEDWAARLALFVTLQPVTEYETRQEAEALLTSLGLTPTAQQALEADARNTHLEDIVAVMRGDVRAPASRGHAQEQPLIDPLSERELEILRLLAAGHSNQEIAERLVVVLGTVKAHNHNILSKLGVRNRTHAVARARELNLL
jgi:LuxR family maltose regulon positive regulatory protein